MRPVDPSKRRRHRPASRRAGSLLPVVALLALSGCESGFGARQAGDPLVGIHAPPMPAPSTGGGAASTQSAANTSTPPLPASMSVPNQAALASGTKQTPDDPRDLRISTPPVVSVSSPGGRAASGNVRVDGPVPIPDSTSRTMPVPPAAPAGTRPADGAVAPPPASMTFEEAQKYLKQRGVVWQRLEVDQGQWKFHCSRPIPNSPNMNSTYETKASDPLSAIRAVIDKIEKDQH